MVRMGTVWDSTVAVLSGRGAVVARVAMATLLLPAIVRDASRLLLPADGVGASLTRAGISLAFAAATLLGTLVLTAIASDPATDEREGYARGGEALGRTIGTVVLLGVAAVVLFLPALILLFRSGFDMRAAQLGASQPTLSPEPLLGAAVYLLVFAVLALWAGARMVLLYAAIVNERLGPRAIGRSFALTRGLALRVIGVLILYGVVLLVAVAAARSVAGIVFRLLVGGDHPALVLFLTAIVVDAVTTVFGVLQPIFAARLYAAVRAEREGAVPSA